MVPTTIDDAVIANTAKAEDHIGVPGTILTEDEFDRIASAWREQVEINAELVARLERLIPMVYRVPA
jgi:hypothetical protein